MHAIACVSHSNLSPYLHLMLQFYIVNLSKEGDQMQSISYYTLLYSIIVHILLFNPVHHYTMLYKSAFTLSFCQFVILNPFYFVPVEWRNCHVRGDYPPAGHC